jgi:enoyl-CoA hydratase/carnithine racemase
MTVTVTYQDQIAVLNLGDDENRFSLGFFDEINSALDDVRDNAQGLVTTGSGKFYSNGLDLDWLMAHGDQMQWYVGQVHALFSRVLTLPMPTAAAINGHAFGAGAMLAMAHDYRTMRSDRGFFCFPEVDIRIPFTPGMAALIQAKLTPQAAIASMTTGRRFGGADAAQYGLVDAAAAEDEVTSSALDLVLPVAGKDPGTVAVVKATMFGQVVTALAAQ